jgi:hypothetical protein
MNPCGTSKLLL